MINKNTMVQATDLCKYFGSGGTLVKAIDKISFSIDKGSFTIILGPSGAGKTTLLNLLGGMDSATDGNLVVDGEDLVGMKNKELTLYRRNKVGFVFQFYNLMPNLTALENVELASEICKDAYDPMEILEKVGLEERASAFPTTLSGGEQQRVSIARAIAKNPQILLCDEPTGALDYKTGKEILRLLHDMSKKEGKTVILVTHNSALKDMGDKVIKVKNGKIESEIKICNPKPIEEIEW
ncbi:MAG: ABC transporter ATP-binding protein [Clostridium sp.]|nr:ABC transporter ATP-binding protein [Clostridium sp.]